MPSSQVSAASSNLQQLIKTSCMQRFRFYSLWEWCAGTIPTGLVLVAFSAAQTIPCVPAPMVVALAGRAEKVSVSLHGLQGRAGCRNFRNFTLAH